MNTTLYKTKEEAEKNCVVGKQQVLMIGNANVRYYVEEKQSIYKSENFYHQQKQNAELRKIGRGN